MIRLTLASLLIFPAGIYSQQTARPAPPSGVIDTPGRYVLMHDTNIGIVITASDVSLDLNGHAINGPGNRSGTGVTVRGARGVAVSGGSISDFGFGVTVENSANVVLSNLRIRAQGLAVPAPPPEVGIMIVQSSNVVVEKNAIYNVGLGIFVRGGMSRGNRIASNTVTAGTNGALGICYNPAPNDDRGPRGDLVAANLVSGFARGIVLSDLSLGNVLQGNTIVHGGTAVQFSDPSNVDTGNVKVALP